jgi:hypothetical protein
VIPRFVDHVLALPTDIQGLLFLNIGVFAILVFAVVTAIQSSRREAKGPFSGIPMMNLVVPSLFCATLASVVLVIHYSATHRFRPVAVSYKKASASTSVIVENHHSEVAFSELLTSEKETPNYGLYSYLLLGNTPQSDDERARDVSAVKAISSFSRASDMRRRFDAQSLNITYLPLRSGVPIRINPTDSDTGKALLKEYDFARARSYLDIIDPTLRRGPYIVSTLQPLTTSNGRPTNFLFQDLSSATPRVVTQWVFLFQVESSNENFWEPDDVQRFALAFRSDLDIIAHDIMPNMPSKLADLIGWHSSVDSSK